MNGRKHSNPFRDILQKLISLGRADTTALFTERQSVLSFVSDAKILLWLFRQQQTCFDPNQRTHGMTPLMDVVRGRLSAQDKIELIDLLIELGAGVDAQISEDDYEGPATNCDSLESKDGHRGATALHFVTSRVLRSRGVRVIEAVTPLEHARQIDCISLVASHLLRHGAYPHQINDEGFTPTALALWYGPSFFLQWRQALQSVGNVKAFVKAELATDLCLYGEGWRQDTLEAALTIALVGTEIKFYTYEQDGRILYPYTKVCGLRRSQPWWYDLLDLIKSRKKPIPPLRAGWRKTTTCSDEPCYVNTKTGSIRSDRPHGLLLSNLRSKKSQQRYKRGEIKFEVEDEAEYLSLSHQEASDESALCHSYSFLANYSTEDDGETFADSSNDISHTDSDSGDETEESSDDDADECLSDSLDDTTSEDSDWDEGVKLCADKEEAPGLAGSEASEDYQDAVEALE